MPLLKVRQDDLSNLLGSAPGVYICELSGGSRNKKKKMFSQMSPSSLWLNPDAGSKRAHQTLQTFKIFNKLLKHRKKYDYYLVYNFSLPLFLASLIAKTLFRKKLYIDYEDDYTTQRKNYIKKLLKKILRKTVDGAICVNEHMIGYFPNKPAKVLNCFANLEYVKEIDFSLRNNMTFLFSGKLDYIRGIDLIPDLVKALRKQFKNFKILITGKGPLLSLVKTWHYPEVEYLGFLDEDLYQKTIQKVDACLVLQKPDQPFNKGSFPSKIDEYARHKKPIFILKLI